jgi:hypothetical protein
MRWLRRGRWPILPRHAYRRVACTGPGLPFMVCLRESAVYLVRFKSQRRFDGIGGSAAKVTRDVRDTFLTDSGVVVEGKRHSSPQTLRGAPHLRMSLCGLSIKRYHPPFSNVYQRPIFLNNIDGNIQLRSFSEELASDRA